MDLLAGIDATQSLDPVSARVLPFHTMAPAAASDTAPLRIICRHTPQEALVSLLLFYHIFSDRLVCALMYPPPSSSLPIYTAPAHRLRRPLSHSPPPSLTSRVSRLPRPSPALGPLTAWPRPSVGYAHGNSSATGSPAPGGEVAASARPCPAPPPAHTADPCRATGSRRRTIRRFNLRSGTASSPRTDNFHSHLLLLKFVLRLFDLAPLLSRSGSSVL